MTFTSPHVRQDYRPDIDGLRTVAVLSVMIFHLNGGWLPGGFAGVDVFFVISGYVVTASLASSHGASLVSFIGGFYARRMARILPALTFMLVVTALTATAFIPPAWLSMLNETTAKYAFFGLSNWIMQNNADTYFGPRAEFNPYTHTWSLGVEEQFYVFAPLLVFIWVKAIRQGHAKPAGFAIGGLVSLTALSFSGCIWATNANPTAAFYFIGYRFWELAVGALTFMVSYQFSGIRERISSAPFRQISSWLGLLLVGLGFVYSKGDAFPFPWVLLPVIGTVLLIAGVSVQPTDFIRRSLAKPLSVWLGKRSYSLYLWHWPVYVVLRWTIGLEGITSFAVALTLTFLIALFSYRYVEQPLNHHAWIQARPNWLKIFAFISIPVTGYLLANHIFDHKSHFSLSRVTQESTDWYAQPGKMAFPNVGNRQCEMLPPDTLQLSNGSELRFSSSSCSRKLTSKKIYVLGDSHATHLAGMLEQISAETGFEIGIFSSPPGCPFLALKDPMADLPVACLDFYRAASREIIEKSMPGDIVLLSSLRMTRWGDHWASFGITDMYAHMYSDNKHKSIQDAIVEAKTWINPFMESGLNVVFVAPTPAFKSPSFRCSDWFNRKNPICVGDNQQPRSELEKLRAPIMSGMQEIANEMDSVLIWDPFPVLCPTETCSAFKDRRPLFFDGDHFSAFGNLVLYPAFLDFIEQNGLLDAGNHTGDSDELKEVLNPPTL
jgi:peptidoglycan/LPS O-acetylase OafA/YrhL